MIHWWAVFWVVIGMIVGYCQGRQHMRKEVETDLQAICDEVKRQGKVIANISTNLKQTTQMMRAFRGLKE